MADNLLYFTELLSMPVLDLKHRRIGRVKDAALVPREHSSRIERFLVGGADTWLTLRFDQIRSITPDSGIQLSDEQLLPYHDDEYMLRIGRDLLDQQIIDVTGRKVVRVTDVTMAVHHDGQREILTVLEVDIGVRSMFRRLFQGVLPSRWVRRLQNRIPPNSIRWDFANVVEPDPLRRLRLNISYEKLEDMHPADLADIVEDLGPAQREAIFDSIDSEAAADALSEVEDPKMQASILEALEPEKAADIVEEMAPDEAADILSELEEETSEEILGEMDSEPKVEVQELLEFDEDTAGGLMNTEYVVLHDNATVADAMAALKGNEKLLESLNTLFLIDEEEHLTAAIPLARLFLAIGDTHLKGLAAETLIQVTVDEKHDRVTEYFDKYNLLTLPVVDEEGKLAGVITADDIISLLRQK
ncbi:MAG TPA: CBS domain-containing protein [Bryobacteraceae bacterium]|nr:CBS domain-containing protein [Bryobacteraceae bacterium]